MPIGQYILSRVDGGLTHDQAVALANAHGGTLAAVTSAQEDTLIRSFLAQDTLLWGGEPHDAAHNGPWIGLSQLPGSSEPGGGWVWDTGESYSYTNWHAGQPDNYLGDSHAIYWDDNGAIGWADQVNDPVSINYGPVVSAAIEVVATVKTLNGTTGHDFIWGGAIGNVIQGLGGDDIIDGNGGKDRILGGKGADVLDGGAGNDTLTGGYGADVLTGGIGADRFVFIAAADSRVVAAFRDHITDFDQAEDDRIVLTAFDAVPGGAHDPLSFMGNHVFTGTGQVRATIHGTETWIDVNLSGDKTPELRIVLDQALTLDQNAFTL
jgi:hypothetical protein